MRPFVRLFMAFSGWIALVGSTVAMAASQARTVELDLAAAIAPLQDSTPGSVRISLKHALSSADYSIEIIRPDGLSNTVDIKALSPFSNWFAKGDCAQVVEAGKAVLASVSEEDVAARWQLLRKLAGATPACSAFFTQNLEQWVNPSGSLIFTLELGDAREIQVRRLASATHEVRTWSTRFAAAPVLRTGLHANEGEWLRNDVELGLARFVAAAARRPLPEGVPVVHGPALSPHVWAPEAYEAATKSALAAAGAAIHPGRQADDESVLAALLEPRSSKIEAQNQLVSARLSSNLLDPEAHAQAAVVLGTLALRESAGAFSDIRPTLSRMTVHLTLARVARGNDRPGVSERFAAILLSALAGRQQEALAALVQVKSGSRSDVVVAWARALETAVDHDWRRIPLPATSLLEKVVDFRAMTEELGPRVAVRRVGASKLDPSIPDWGRIAFGANPGIELGHVFSDLRLKSELEDAVSVGGKVPASRDLAAHLQQRWGPTLKRENGRYVVQVLDRGAWAESARRHLLSAVVEEVDFTNALGLPAEAKALRGRAEQFFGELPAFDFVLAELNQPVCERLAGLVTREPERVPAKAWHTAQVLCVQKMRAFPPLSGWFDPLILPGTAYDAERTHGPAGANFPSEQRALLYVLAPFSEAATRGVLYGKGPATSDDRTRVYGKRVDYSIAVLQEILEAQGSDPAAAQTTARKLCELDSDRCLALGDALREQDPDGAAAAYQKAIASGVDSVTASRYAGWLVDYQLWRGDRARAREAAEAGASTGSGAGMMALAWFWERTGDMVSAETLYRQLEDRYRDRGPLDQFFARRILLKDAGYERKATLSMARLFPLGLRLYDGALLSVPESALKVLTETPASQKAGLLLGDLIVAVDGYALDRLSQFDVLRLAGSGPIELVVWSPGRKNYRKVSIAHAVRRELGVRTGWVGRTDEPPSEIGGLTVDQWIGVARDKTDTNNATALTSLLQFEDRAVPALRTLLQDADPDVRQRTFAALLRWPVGRVALMGSDVLDAIVKERAPMARSEGFTLLGQLARMGHKPSQDLLLKLVDDPDPDNPLYAAQQLAILGNPARPALPRLKFLLSQEKDPMRQLSLRRAIEVIEAAKP